MNITSVCDGVYDCHDQSDERKHLDEISSSCTRNDCGKRSHCGEMNCRQTPAGVHCYCLPGYKQDGDNKRCVGKCAETWKVTQLRNAQFLQFKCIGISY